MYCQIKEVIELINELKETISVVSWNKAYSYRIDKFFYEYMAHEKNKNRRLMAITENEVNDFISTLPYKHNEKVNYYRALKKFFDFSARKGLTQPFYVKVDNIKQEKTIIKYINENDLSKIINFINSDAKIEHRLMLALFLYTGLSRKFIINLTYDQISEDLTYFKFNSGEILIPIKPELTNLLFEYKKHSRKLSSRNIFEINESTLSKEVNYISKNACGHSYNPTEYSNTFIIKALGNDKWANIYIVSRLTMESITTIEKHISDSPEWLIDEQRKILNRWK